MLLQVSAKEVSGYLRSQRERMLAALDGIPVTTLFGPASLEDQIYVQEVPSVLNAGVAVDDGLTRLGFLVHRTDPSSPLLLHALTAAKVVFINAHGDMGECGRIQGILDVLKIPYTGSGLAGSAACLDKAIFRSLASAFDLRSAPGAVIRNVDQFDAIASEFGYPLIAKPLRGGSSVGVRVVSDQHERGIVEQLLAQRGSRELLVESYIPGRDFTVGALEWQDSIVFLPLLEIIAKAGFYSEDSKMRDHWVGSVQYVVRDGDDAKSFEPIYVGLRHLWKVLHLRGAVRFDFRLGNADTPFLLEANTNPGLSSQGNLAVAARSWNINFDELLMWILGSVAYDDPSDGSVVRLSRQ